jgi:hypothetical protein
MQLQLTPDEYRLLLDTVSIADWVMHAHDEEDREDTAEHRALFQKIYAQAAEAGCGDLVAHDEELGGYYETERFEAESPVQALIEEYDEDSFWDELASRLAWRDAAREEGEERLDAMGGRKRAVLLAKLEEEWSAELEEYGLERLDVVEEAD